MLTGIRRLLNCPYCSRRKGIIAIDFTAIPAILGVAKDDAIFIPKHPQQRVILFDPDTDGNDPCPHVVHMTSDISCRQLSADGEYINLGVGLSCDWYTPLLDDADPQKDNTDLIWDTLADRDYETFDPDVAYKFVENERKWTTSGKDGSVREYSVFAKAFLSVDVEEFFSEFSKTIDRFA